MYFRFAICALIAAAAGGCSKPVTVKDEEGDKVTITEGSDGKTTVESEADGGNLTYESEEDRVTMTDEEGNVVQYGGNVSEEDLGLPFYPGSKETGDSVWTAEGIGRKSVTSVRTTSDPVSSVIGFYRDKVGMIDNEINWEDTASILATDENRKIFLNVSRVDGRTEIALTVTEGE
ncbi:MAG: hypothetical protein IH851_05295 [Armatimonadetes bacterium]|nr:hypothetical protein [Armatimonadota bacterium]